MEALSWDEICERAKQNNKTVICEVDKRAYKRFFKIRCNICGHEAEKQHFKFNECKICNTNNKRSNTNEFIIKAKKIHGDKYNYDLVEYINSYTKIKILCNKCNQIFEQKPNSHLCGNGCLSCGIVIRNKKITTIQEEFIIKAKEIHDDRYNYDLVEYINSYTKIKILCNICNKIFEQRPSSHLCGDACRFCAYNLLQDKFKLSIDEFILKAKLKHGNKYNYDLVEYINGRTYIKILCNKCNQIFEQKATSHLQGCGCPNCNESKGELRIAKYLSQKNIKFKRNKFFKGLKDKGPLRPDFYIIELNLLIEYDGAGHYLPCFGSTPEEKQKNLEDCQRRDKIKNEWVLKNNIPLLRIPYWDFDRIEELIEAFILEHRNKKDLFLEI
jgi:Zn finger protein HypA/HybF involved in hydrogenase expression